MANEIFRAYDIRGIYGSDLSPKIAVKIGKAFGTFVGSGKTVAVGRDIRLSGKILQESLVKGLISTGCNVVDIGLVPSPVLYFSVPHKKFDAGVMVTASHLPPQWNGFKFCNDKGIVISEGNGLEKIKEIFMQEKFNLSIGKIAVYKNILMEYKNFIKSKIKIKKKLKVVVDFGNSVAALVVPQILKELDCEVIFLHEKLDGMFPNRPSEPNEKSLVKLKEKVSETNADLGIAFDGDGDRVAFVDDKSRIFFSGNTTIPIFANFLLRDRKGKVILDLTCSSAVENFIREMGGEPVIIRVGHSYISNEVASQNAIFGGQYSGHMCFPETYCTDDAIFAGTKMVEIISGSDMKLSEIVDSLPKNFSTEMEEIPCSDKMKFLVVEKIKDKITERGFKILNIDGVKAFTENGWLLVRASNTSPIIRVIADGKSEEAAQKLHQLGSLLVKEAIQNE